MTKKQSYNWFGIEEENPKKKKYVPFSFLGMKTNPKQRSPPSKVSFLGKPNKNLKMTPSPLFRKESINHRKKLSKYGDADFDGSPNYFDCDPTHFLKDGKLGKKLKEKLNLTREYLAQRAEEKSKKKYFGQEALAKAERYEKRYKVAAEKTEKIKAGMSDFLAGKKEKIDQLRSEGKKVPREQIKELKQFEKSFKISGKKLDKELKAKEKEATGLKSSAEGYLGLEDTAKITGPAGTVAMKQFAIQQKLAAGKPVSQKQVKALIEAQKKTTVGARAERLAGALAVGGVTGLVTGKGLTKKGTYTKEMIARSARVRKLTKGALGQVFGPALTAKGFASEPRGRGRPAGPSGEYKIGGKPVYEEEFRQWQAKQNALNRMLPSEAQSQTLNQEYLDYIKAQQIQQQMQAQQAAQQVPQETMGSQEEGMNEPVPSDQAPQTEGMTNEAVQAIEEAKRRPYIRSSQEEIRQAQQAAQEKDQILNAPNFMKGELKAAGGSILTPQGPQIMDAPNAFKGELRNVYKTDEDGVPAVRLSERPQTNPYGDEYLEIELGSGKPVVRKRIREKWMTGEAL